MNPLRPLRHVPPSGWAEAVDSVQQFLERNIADLDSRQRAFARRLASRSAAPSGVAEQLGRWSVGFTSALESAEGRTAETESQLGNVQEILGAWLSDVDDLRERLAKWKAGSV